MAEGGAYRKGGDVVAQENQAFWRGVLKATLGGL